MVELGGLVEGRKLISFELLETEQAVKHKEDVAAQAGIVIEEKNWPSFLPIIHHDIANEIPVHLQRLQYVALQLCLGLQHVSYGMLLQLLHGLEEKVPQYGCLLLSTSYMVFPEDMYCGIGLFTGLPCNITFYYKMLSISIRWKILVLHRLILKTHPSCFDGISNSSFSFDLLGNSVVIGNVDIFS